MFKGNDEQFIICDIGDVIEKYQQWQKLLPRVKMYYGKFKMTKN